VCGIAGVRYVDDRPVSPTLIRAMTDSIFHRGPDAEGLWGASGIGLGHRRLAIVDPNGSAQPMQDRQAVVCFNGEIFNHRELRRELGGDAYNFRTAGDTEVLLALHRHLGANGVSRIQGQFVYALWELRTRELWIHRDPLGILPLYFYWDGEQLVFASEIKALVPALSGRIAIDDASIKEFLAYRAVPWPNTLLRGIQKLPPGHTLHLDGRGKLTCRAYWTLPNEEIRTQFGVDGSLPSAVDRLDDVLQRSVAARQVADVPVGALLSGGLDSSLIVALMARGADAKTIRTYSAGFDDLSHDERSHARAVSFAVGTRHSELVIRPSDFENLWPKLTWHRDAPLSEPSEVGRFLLAMQARADVKVLLCGEGADELFAGYPKYAHARMASFADVIPQRIRGEVFWKIEGALPVAADRIRVMIRAMGARNEADRMQAWFAPFIREEREFLVAGPERDGHARIAERARGDLIQRMLYFDCHTWLVDNLLESLDRMAMAASVEARPPFLDRELVEFAFSQPSSAKIRSGKSKWLLREVARRHLPRHVVDRKKVGFRVPLDDWFRGGLRAMANDLLLRPNSFVSSHMSRDVVRRLLSDHQSRARQNGIRIWTLVGLEIWHEYVARPWTSLREQEGRG
jgi:asparagine synthase (glutamine-hydrolysing)